MKTNLETRAGVGAVLLKEEGSLKIVAGSVSMRADCAGARVSGTTGARVSWTFRRAFILVLILETDIHVNHRRLLRILLPFTLTSVVGREFASKNHATVRAGADRHIKGPTITSQEWTIQVN